MIVYWSDEEIKMLKRLYPNTPRNVVEGILKDRSWKGITAKAHQLGIKRGIKKEGLLENIDWGKIDNHID